MDDRFDFILCGKEVMDNTYNVRYIDGTYRALGQDSRRFNGDVLSPLNSMVPNKIANALYDMSDHLPVIMEVAVKKNKSGMQPQTYSQRPMVTYPDNQQVKISSYQLMTRVVIMNMNGVEIMEVANPEASTEITFRSDGLPSGVYLVEIQTIDHQRLITKIVNAQ